MNESNLENKVILIKIDDIIPNRFQPREIFDETGLKELADSIKEHGVIQPILVRRLGDKYELIAGERRIKASALAGKTTIPAIVREMNDRESAKVSLLENLQRRNLSAIEEAKTYKKILELENMTQEELARTMGRSQPMVANKLRLLSLPEEVQEALMKNQISERHARSLLTIADKKEQLIFLDRIRNERLTVRELDSEIKKYKNKEKNSENKSEEEDKERFMNNNRSNFGGMGLNDYQSGVNNMFNNIPNNFNNMSTGTEMVNSTNNSYNEFGNNDNGFNNQDITTTDYNGMSNQMMNSTPSSLGSMFDGVSSTITPANNTMDNEGNNNLFVSQIREDNVPPKENQFLPTFDDNMPVNNFNTDIGTNNAFNGNQMPNNNFNEPMNNMYQQPNVNTPSYINNQFSMNEMPIQNNSSLPGMMSNQFENGQYSQQNSFNDNMMPNNFGYNQQMQTMNINTPFSTSQQNPTGNSNFYGNPDTMLQTTQQLNYDGNINNQPLNNNFSTNNLEQYNTFDVQNNNIPDFGIQNNNYSTTPNNGGLFNQPLNIVEPYGPSEVNEQENLNVVNNNPSVKNMPVSNQNSMNFEVKERTEIPEVNNLEKSVPEINNYENVTQDINNQDYNEEVSQGEIPPEEVSQEEINLQSENENIPNIPDIEVIGDGDVTIPTDEEIKETESKNDYIRLEDEITIHSVRDAVMELKKTTDRIKQNHINIETEEIDFDDVYQITIKIKKEEI